MRDFEPLVDGVVGSWYGDESKALTVARKAQAGEYDYVARYNGGNNAGGHVAMPDGTVYKFNLLPAGLVFGVPGILGKGVLLNPQALYQEIEEKRAQGLSIDEGNLVVSDRATAILPEHIYSDQKKEQGQDRQGSTQKGISQAAAARYGRSALTMEAIAADLPGAEKMVMEGVYQSLAGRQFDLDALQRATLEARGCPGAGRTVSRQAYLSRGRAVSGPEPGEQGLPIGYILACRAGGDTDWAWLQFPAVSRDYRRSKNDTNPSRQWGIYDRNP
jgi:hypothetical protein